MAKTSIEIYKHIEELTKRQQVKHDLPFLVNHYQTLKDMGLKDCLLVELFNLGILEMALKETIDGLKERILCQ